ncbi:hypothetical protein [Cellulomonas oligotrophica]|uniref:Uncharacterized protein n=1 Tax=Cellulomonas oligotrophica TaxID=931536 RepID=A0A7Y9FJL0_9CELL|nr:hypothetical protein [Cellulomonas oligotrophica]NYD87226.1 hypothetical protein [Cellulomonas oligotrophica]GIG34008.1 hypothetical protein Col01nite_31670 [Cellulomonas oligotrophica]
MDRPRPQGRPVRRRGTDVRRARWAAALAAVGAAGLWSSSHAAGDALPAASVPCTVRDVRWAYDVEGLAPRGPAPDLTDPGGQRTGAAPAVVGVAFAHVPPDCTGRLARVVYVDAEGHPVARTTVRLWTGVRDVLDAPPGAPDAVDARWVVLPG